MGPESGAHTLCSEVHYPSGRCAIDAVSRPVDCFAAGGSGICGGSGSGSRRSREGVCRVQPRLMPRVARADAVLPGWLPRNTAILSDCRAILTRIRTNGRKKADGRRPNLNIAPASSRHRTRQDGGAAFTTPIRAPNLRCMATARGAKAKGRGASDILLYRH